MVQQFPTTPPLDTTLTWTPYYTSCPDYILEGKIKLMECLQRIAERSDHADVKETARIKLLEQIKSIV